MWSELTDGFPDGRMRPSGAILFLLSIVKERTNFASLISASATE